MNAEEYPLCLAAAAGLTAIAQALIIYGADVHVRDGYGQPLLHLAAREGHDDVIRLFLSHGVAVNDTDSRGRTALHIAAFHGHNSTTKLIYLSTPGIDIGACDTERATALCVAVRENHRSVALQILDEEPANINARCLGQKTALHFAIENGSVLLACLFVDLDSLDPNICDGHGWNSSQLRGVSGRPADGRAPSY